MKLILVAAVVVMVAVLAVNLIALEGSGVVTSMENGFKGLINAVMPVTSETQEIGGTEEVNTSEEQTIEAGTQETLSPELMIVQEKNEKRLVDGCLAGKDCVPSIDAPKFVTAGKAGFMKNDDAVIGLFYEGEARAYPLKIMDYHEVVNDEFGGKKVVVTYCPLSGAAAVYKADGMSEVFGVSGKLLNSNLVIYNRATGSLWSQMTGVALAGSQTGNKLDEVPVQVLSLKEWTALHPKSKVLSAVTGFKRDYDEYPYGDYRENPVVYYPLEHEDGRLPAKTEVFGVIVGDKTKAYPVTELMKALPEGGEFEDKIGENKITIAYEGVEFKATDVVTKEAVAIRQAYWFAWTAFYPQTEVFTAIHPKAI